MRYQNNKSKNLNFDKIFLNVHFSITIAHKDFNFCLLSPHIEPNRSKNCLEKKTFPFRTFICRTFILKGKIKSNIIRRNTSWGEQRIGSMKQ